MPKVFEKNCKIKVIEYGSAHAHEPLLSTLKEHIVALYKRFFKAEA